MNSADRLCLVWSVVVVVFFSLSQSKLPGYILSVTVACGILLARLFDAALAAPEGRAARLVRRAGTAFAVVCLFAAVAAAAGASRWPSFVRLLHIPAADAAQIGRATVTVVLVLVGFGVFGLVARYRRSIPLCFLCLALFPPVSVQAGAGALEVVFNAKSGRRIASQLAALPPANGSRLPGMLPQWTALLPGAHRNTYFARRPRIDEQLYPLNPGEVTAMATADRAAFGL